MLGNAFIAAAEAATVSSIVTEVTSIVTSAASWVSTFATKITETPLLLMFTIVPLVGLGVGLLKRLFSVN